MKVTMERGLVSWLTVAMIICVAGPALAQQPEPAQTSAGSTEFVTLDRVGERSTAGLALSYLVFDGDADGARVDLHGQYVSPAGIGGYVQLPVGLVFGADDDESAVGGLELGATYTVPGSAPFVLRGGLVLPTADDSLSGSIANLYTGVARVTDLVLAAPDSTWMRLAVSPVFRSGTVFARIDGGFDVPISSEDGIDPDTLVRINAGVGVDTGNLMLTGELATIGTTGDADDLADRFLHTMAISVRFPVSGAHGYAALVLPMDDDFNNVIDLALTVGFTARLDPG